MTGGRRHPSGPFATPAIAGGGPSSRLSAESPGPVECAGSASGSVLARVTAAVLLAVVAACPSGCLSPRNVRLPTVTPRSIPYERAESRVHDPFNNVDAGPDTFNRPPGFTSPRAEPVRVREQTGLSGLRQQIGTPTPPLFPFGVQPSYGTAVS